MAQYEKIPRGVDIDDYGNPRDEFTRFILKYYVPKEMVIKDLENLLENGHGGGSWRRLIIQLIGGYQKKEALEYLKK